MMGINKIAGTVSGGAPELDEQSCDEVMMLRRFHRSFADAKVQYEAQPARDAALVCRAGPHMNCAVIKLQKSAWTNDDLTKMANQTGIFFSIWVDVAGASKGRASYNIHAMSVRQVKRYRLTGNAFCKRFREAFDKVRSVWPNVSTDFGCCTLMQGWFDIDQTSLASDALRLMRQFDRDVAPMIDDLLAQSTRPLKRRGAAIAWQRRVRAVP